MVWSVKTSATCRMAISWENPHLLELGMCLSWDPSLSTRPGLQRSVDISILIFCRSFQPQIPDLLPPNCRPHLPFVLLFMTDPLLTHSVPLPTLPPTRNTYFATKPWRPQGLLCLPPPPFLWVMATTKCHPSVFAMIAPQLAALLSALPSCPCQTISLE